MVWVAREQSKLWRIHEFTRYSLSSLRDDLELYRHIRKRRGVILITKHIICCSIDNYKRNTYSYIVMRFFTALQKLIQHLCIFVELYQSNKISIYAITILYSDYDHYMSQHKKRMQRIFTHGLLSAPINLFKMSSANSFDQRLHNMFRWYEHWATKKKLWSKRTAHMLTDDAFDLHIRISMSNHHITFKQIWSGRFAGIYFRLLYIFWSRKLRCIIWIRCTLNRVICVFFMDGDNDSVKIYLRPNIRGLRSM